MFHSNYIFGKGFNNDQIDEKSSQHFINAWLTTIGIGDFNSLKIPVHLAGIGVFVSNLGTLGTDVQQILEEAIHRRSGETEIDEDTGETVTAEGSAKSRFENFYNVMGKRYVPDNVEDAVYISWGFFEDFILKGEVPIGLPQYAWVTDIHKNIAVDFVGRYENLNEDFKKICQRVQVDAPELPHTFKTDHKPFKEYHTQATIDKVAQVFKEDIELFKYDY